MVKLLIVDDEEEFQIALQMYLESQGYQVQCANSGAEALEMFAQDPPDLIISDVIMSEMDGFEFCRRIRAIRSGQLVPFIFLSGQGELNYRVEGYSKGADDYLVKPFQPQEILAKVKSQLERSRRINSEIIRLLQTSKDMASAPAPTIESLPLSFAETKVFWEAIQGYTNKQISARLCLSPRTVQAHLSSIFNKLKVKNRSQLVRFALERGYKPPKK